MVLRLCLAGSLAWLLASCGLPNGLPASDPLSRTAALPAVQVDAECDAPVFDIQGSRRWDAARSQLIIKVYREGEWARFGHNHVLEVKSGVPRGSPTLAKVRLMFAIAPPSWSKSNTEVVAGETSVSCKSPMNA